ncbi:hypothetical protein P170DRAFT_431655 [Aspergillus steynii IBT 23096]|uniref:Uncharacterized protein n=1 Tax=Aspergillus steynii IBT 23096 TaxID=1392250 RepID=A0A2I2GLY2_9EURO|nr:uncharacterized protein P170DRAFT_431655 [Aspergillus steynii IBT 23096]PLB53883.1 hypothetical protein P170DRAFT_431655 [Aspergillus steynii IBT 23096]
MRGHQVSLRIALPGPHHTAWLPTICYAISLTTTTYTLGISQQLLHLIQGLLSNSNNENKLLTGASAYLSSVFYWILMLFHFLAFMFLVWSTIASVEPKATTEQRPEIDKADDPLFEEILDASGDDECNNQEHNQLVLAGQTPEHDSDESLSYETESAEAQSAKTQTQSRCQHPLSLERSNGAPMQRNNSEDLPSDTDTEDSVTFCGNIPYLPLVPLNIKQALALDQVGKALNSVTDLSKYRTNNEIYR